MALTEIDAISLELEKRDALLGELVVARQSALGDLVARNRVVERDFRDGCEDRGGPARRRR